MAQFHVDFWGPKLELTHDEVETLGQSGDITAALLGFGAAAPPPADLVLGLFAAYIAAQMAIIRAVDQGNGVWLTLTWPAVAWGAWWAIIPTTR